MTLFSLHVMHYEDLQEQPIQNQKNVGCTITNKNFFSRDSMVQNPLPPCSVSVTKPSMWHQILFRSAFSKCSNG